MPRRAMLMLAGSLAATSGCVSHVARVDAPADGGSAAIGTTVHEDMPPQVEERGAQPREIPVSTWRRDDEGNILRGEGVVRTPTPWWQRFPADVVSDVLIPTPVIASATVVVPTAPIPASDPVALAERARRAGYAAP